MRRVRGLGRGAGFPAADTPDFGKIAEHLLE
jgi:hypothetical protein